MADKHTKGPWRVEPDLRDQEYGQELVGWDIVSDSSPIVGCEGIEAWFENGEANAHLMAAAPDLLEMLIYARAELAGLPHSLGYDFTHLPKIDAAIRKATGESA